MTEKTYCKIAVSILLLYTAICIITAFFYLDNLLWGSFEKFDNDDVKYLRSAETFLKTGKITYNNPEQSTAYIMPGIVFTLVPFVKFFGIENAGNVFRIFNILIESVSLFIIFLIVLELANAKTALIALVLNVMYIPNLYASLQVLTDTIFLFFLALFLLVAIKGNEKNKRYYLLLGIIFGISLMYRATSLVFPIILVAVWIIKRVNIKENFKYLIYFIIPFLIIMFPWWIRNYVNFNKIIIYTYSSGNPMLMGAFCNNEYDYELLKELDIELQTVNNEIERNEIELKYFKEVQKNNFENNFLGYLKWNTVDKFFCSIIFPYYHFDLYNIGYITVLIQHIIYISFSVYTFLTVKNRIKYLFISISIIFIIVHLPFLIWPRYIYPAMPFMVSTISLMFCKREIV